MTTPRRQGGSNQPQDVVAHRVTVLVVQQLESVDVDEQNSDRISPIGAPPQLQLTPEKFLESSAVGEVGQRVLAHATLKFEHLSIERSSPLVFCFEIAGKF